MYKLNPKQIEILKARGYTDPQIKDGHVWAFRQGDVMPSLLDDKTLLEVECLRDPLTFKQLGCGIDRLWIFIRVIGAIASRRTRFCAIAGLAAIVVAIVSGVALLLFIGAAIVLASLIFDVMRSLRTGEFWRSLEQFGGDRSP